MYNKKQLSGLTTEKVELTSKPLQTINAVAGQSKKLYYSSIALLGSVLSSSYLYGAEQTNNSGEEYAISKTTLIIINFAVSSMIVAGLYFAAARQAKKTEQVFKDLDSGQRFNITVDEITTKIGRQKSENIDNDAVSQLISAVSDKAESRISDYKKPLKGKIAEIRTIIDKEIGKFESIVNMGPELGVLGSMLGLLIPDLITSIPNTGLGLAILTTIAGFVSRTINTQLFFNKFSSEGEVLKEKTMALESTFVDAKLEHMHSHNRISSTHIQTEDKEPFDLDTIMEDEKLVISILKELSETKSFVAFFKKTTELPLDIDLLPIYLKKENYRELIKTVLKKKKADVEKIIFKKNLPG